MFSTCANPECRAEFDYHEGEFFRFRRPPGDDGRPANTHSVQHLWLCGKCAASYYLEHVRNRGILLRSRASPTEPPDGPLLVTAA
jgi:hypothetical protein